MLRLQGHRGKVRALAFSPDGQLLASAAGRDRHALLWRLPRGCTLSPFAEGERVEALAFAASGAAVVLATGRYLRRWDLAANTLDQRWRRGANHIWQVAFSPDGSRVAATTYDRSGMGDRYRVNLFRPDGASERAFLTGDYGSPQCLAFSPDGRYLAAGCDGNVVRVWSMKEKAKSFSLPCADEGGIAAVAFSADESRLAVAASDALGVYDVAARELCAGQIVSAPGVRALAASPDGTLLSAADDGTARLWDLAPLRERACFDWKIGGLNAAAFSPDGTLASVGGDGEIVVWDVA
jgi:WD40 repeat protein